MKKILIIGGSGFIGNKIYKELNNYFQTFGTYSFSETYSKNNHFHLFKMEDGGLLEIINEIKPELIISSLRGHFDFQLKIHDLIIDYVKNNDSKILFLSSSNVFDAFRHYPSYEDDKTFSESSYGVFKIKIENKILRLPLEKYIIIRLPMVWGNNSPRILTLDHSVKNEIPIEVFPNTIINVISINRLSQQIHYIINMNINGILHLGSFDLICHFEFIKKLVKRRSLNKALFKRVFSTNQIRYIAVLAKKKLPKHLKISYLDVLNDLTLIKNKK